MVGLRTLGAGLTVLCEITVKEGGVSLVGGGPSSMPVGNEEASASDTNQTCPLTTCCVTQPRPVYVCIIALRNIQIDQYLTPSIVPCIRGAIAGRAWAECSVQCKHSTNRVQIQLR